MDPKKLLIAILGLAADASDEEITAAAEKFGKEEKKEPEHKQEGGQGAPSDDVKALSATVADLGQKVVALSAHFENGERDGIIALAASEGKVVPDECKGLPIASLRTLCAKLPVTVPVKRETPEVIILSADAKVIDPVQRQINANLGISDEQFAKHNR